MESFTSPPLCANCGSSKVTATWIISRRQYKFSPWTFLTMPFGVSTTRRMTYAFEMPICRKCQAKLDGIDKLTTGINYSTTLGCGGIFGIGLIVLMAMGESKYSWMVYVPFAVLLAVPGVAIGRGIGKIIEWTIKYLTIYDFCDFNGQYFRFENKKFEREFALLNPGWVKPKSKRW